MSNSPAKPTPDVVDLIRLFYPDTQTAARLKQVGYDEVPGPYHDLLVHNAHMTVSVESHHASPVTVEVLAISESPKEYARKILLRRETDGTVVQFGIVRLHQQYLPKAAWEKIRDQSAPLGRILIEQDVLRNVELVSTWQVQPAAEMAKLMEIEAGQTVYGRTALIHVDDEPAIELFEVVCGLGGQP